MSTNLYQNEPVAFRAPQHVFVYGSLKKGFGNNTMLTPSQAFYCGEFTTKAKGFEMRSYGGFPCVLDVEKNGKKIMGELYLCTPALIDRLDQMEGHPHWYKRKRVLMQDGTWAFMYVMPTETVEDLPLVDTIETDEGEVYLWKEREVRSHVIPIQNRG